MSHRSQSPCWLAMVAGLTVAVSGCANTSQTNVSLPNTGWMASLKQKLTPQRQFATIVEETNNREPSANLFIAYGKLEESRNNLPKAQEAYNTALKKDANSHEAILGLARLEQLAGRPQTAEEGFLKAKELAPENPDVLVAIGQFYASQKRYNEAIAHHHQAFQLNPVNKVYRYELARVLTQAGRVDEGLAHFEQTVGIAAAEYNVGVILHEQGRLADAEQHLLKATIHNPQMQQAQEWLDVVRRDKAQQNAILAAQSQPASPIQQASGQYVRQTPPPTAQMPPMPAQGAMPQYQTQQRPHSVMPQQSSAPVQQQYQPQQQRPAATMLNVQPIPGGAATR